MVICKSFQNSKIGYCRFGSNCVFEHVDIKKIVESEAELAIESSQWVLSCFGPFKEKTCIPNFIDDQSFEEVRLSWYEAKKEDRLPQFQQKYNLQVLEAKYKMVQLTFLSSEVLKTLTKIYDSDTEPNKNIFIGATNPFSSTTTLPFSSKSTNNSSIFGINQIQANPFAKSTSINFGSNTSTPVFNSSIFRSVNASSSENNTQKQSSIFGSELVIQKQQKNPFGESLIKQSILSSDQTKEQKSGMLVKNSQNKELTSPNKLFSLPSTLPNPNEPIDSPFKAIGPPLGTTIQKTLPNPNEPIDSQLKAIGPPLGTTVQKTLPNPNESIDSPFKAIGPPLGTAIQKTFDWDSSRKPFAETEFKNQINRLEKIIERLERLVPEKQLEISKKVYNSVIETTEQLQNQCNLEDTLNNNQEDENNSALNLNNNLEKYRKEDDNCREEENTDILDAYNRSISRSNSPPLFVPFVSNIKTKVYDLPSIGRTKIKCLEKITNVPLRFKPLIYEAQTSTKIDVPLSLSPPQFKKIDKKWIIEHQKSNQNLLIEDAKIDNMIKMYECENSILTIKGKVNSVFMDSCKKCYLFVDSVVSSIEFVNCQSVQMQILKKCPTISIKKTDGCQMYLTKNSLDVEILSSKSSKMNAMIPKDNGDYIGQLIPEQYRTLIKGTSLQTTCVESEYFLK